MHLMGHSTAWRWCSTSCTYFASAEVAIVGEAPPPPALPSVQPSPAAARQAARQPGGSCTSAMEPHMLSGTRRPCRGRAGERRGLGVQSCQMGVQQRKSSAPLLPVGRFVTTPGSHGRQRRDTASKHGGAHPCATLAPAPLLPQPAGAAGSRAPAAGPVHARRAARQTPPAGARSRGSRPR